jgi:MoaA/NifB/PqqE/SkfB family radical SAM enzyme
VKSTSSEPSKPSSDQEKKEYFCEEPWTGIFSIQTNQDVTFCPCYLKMRIGNLNETSMQEIWNSPVLVGMRHTFSKGELPEVCEGQLCPVVRGEGR